MPEIRRKYDLEFKAGAVRIVRETRRPVAEIARELRIDVGTLGNWVRKDRTERDEADGLNSDDRAELVRLRLETWIGIRDCPGRSNPGALPTPRKGDSRRRVGTDPRRRQAGGPWSRARRPPPAKTRAVWGRRRLRARTP